METNETETRGIFTEETQQKKVRRKRKKEKRQSNV